MDSYGKDLVKAIAFVVAFGFIVWFIIIFLTVEAFYGVLAIRVAVRWFSPLLRASGAF